MSLMDNQYEGIYTIYIVVDVDVYGGEFQL